MKITVIRSPHEREFRRVDIALLNGNGEVKLQGHTWKIAIECEKLWKKHVRDMTGGA